MTHRWRRGADLAAVALLVWLGIHAIRIYLAMVGWVLGGPLSTVALGTLLLGLWTGGQFGWPVANRLGGERPTLRLGLLFGATYTLYHALPGPTTGPVFGCVIILAWLWLFPTALRAIALGGSSEVFLPGVVLGLAGQVSLQTLLHGMDMVQLLGLWPTVASVVLVGALLLALRQGSPGATPPNPTALATAEPPPLPGWGLIALGPYLALQMTLAANLGWVQHFTGLELAGAALVILAGLLLGLAAAALRFASPLRVLAGLLVAGLLLQPDWLTHAPWLIALLQPLLTLTLAPALAPRPKERAGRTYLWWGIGSYIMICLVLLFYLGYEAKPLWPVMAAAAVTPGLLHRPAIAFTIPWRKAAVGLLVVGSLGVGLSLLPRTGDRPADSPAPAELTAMTFNLHHTFDLYDVPNPEAIARVIEAADPDFVGLQEIGRGWNMTGAGDLVAWLRWRFPQYHVLYGKTEGDLVGNALMSRYPIIESGWGLYDMKVSDLQRGWIWARIPTVRGDLLLTNTHLSAFRGEEPDRINQAKSMIRFWGQRPRFLLVGDLNALPETEPMQRLRASGLVDLPAQAGLGQTPTFPASEPRRRLDYLWGSPDLEVLSAQIIESTASDHRPVVVRFRLTD